MLTDNLLDKILTVGPQRYFRITNQEGKTWYMPSRHMSVAMALYQPGSLKGRMLCRWFPTLQWLPGVARVVHAQPISLSLVPELDAYIRRTFGTDDYEWSLFGGTPSVHQKITMQIFRGNHILGYLKLTNEPEIAALFDHERSILKSVDGLNAPRVLSQERVLVLSDGTEVSVFAQSTAKSRQSANIHYWTDEHERFVDRLCESTCKTILFDDTDYCRLLASIDAYLPNLEPDLGSRLRKHRDHMMAENHGKMVSYSAYHADFTPWNIIANPDGLFVFDWEYAMLTCPPKMDRWHYLIQTAIFERRLTYDEIMAMVDSSIRDDADRHTLYCYLLEVASRFVARERGNMPHCLGMSLRLWVDLMDRYQ